MALSLLNLPFTPDTRAKGPVFLFYLDLRCGLSLIKVPAGRVLRKDLLKTRCSNDIIFIECRNFCRFKVGYLAVARMHNSWKSFNEDVSYTDYTGVFMCLVLGCVYDPFEKNLKILLRKKKERIIPLSFVVQEIGENSFETIFDEEVVTIPLSHIEIIYLNQVSGPKLNGVIVGESVPHEEESALIASKITPDWCPVTYDGSCVNLNGHVAKFNNKETLLNTSCHLCRENIRSKARVSKFLPRVMKRFAEPCTVFYCMKRETPLQLTLEKFHLIEYPCRSNKESSVISLAPITSTQLENVRCQFDNASKNGKMPMDCFCDLLDGFMIENGMDIVVLHEMKLKDHYDSIVVSMIDHDDELLLEKPDLNDLGNGVYTGRMSSGKRDHEFENGFVVFRGYTWPYKKVLNTATKAVMDQTFNGKGLKRSCTDHEGSFEMIGPRQSDRAYGSMAATPGNTRNHFYFRNNNTMNRTLLPHAMNIINELSNQARLCQFSCGDSLMGILHYYGNCEGEVARKSVCPFNIYSKIFHCTLHFDVDLLDDEELESFNNFIENEPILKAYWSKAKDLMNSDDLSKPTTCCWTIVASDDYDSLEEEYEHRQFFTLENCGVAYNLCSDVIELLGQIGATFYASCIFHNTTVPIWIDWENGMVAMTCPNQKYNTAWGNSGGPAKDKSKRKANSTNKKRKKGRFTSENTVSFNLNIRNDSNHPHNIRIKDNRDGEGVKITKIGSGSCLTSLQVNDVIVSVNGSTVENVGDYLRLIDANMNSSVSIGISRSVAFISDNRSLI